MRKCTKVEKLTTLTKWLIGLGPVRRGGGFKKAHALYFPTRFLKFFKGSTDSVVKK